MPVPSGPRRPFRPRLLLTAAVVGTALLASCDAGPADPATDSARPSSPASTGPPSTLAASTASTAAGATTPPATPTGPATPTATPGTFAIAVAGAGQVTYPVSGVRCAGSTVSGTATPTGGGASGTVTLETGTGVLTVAGLPPLDGTRLTGSVTGAATTGAEVRWTGDATGSAASLLVTCP